MFFAVIIVPATGIYLLGGPSVAISDIVTKLPGHLDMFANPDGSPVTLIAIVSLLAWGLGYPGQPHIIVRFMAIRSAKEVKTATRIAMTWVCFSLSAAVAIGLVGRLLYPTLQGGSVETIFMIMTERLFTSVFAGIILAAILAAIMSTASSQLLVTASSIAQDFYKTVFRKNADEKELLFVNRWTVVVVSMISIGIASNPNNMVLDLVAYAWAGFGAAFGPLTIFSLFWRETTRNGALAGVITGGCTVLLWKQFGNPALYEIIPGFIAACIAIYVVSKLDNPPPQEVLEEFDVFSKMDN